MVRNSYNAGHMIFHVPDYEYPIVVEVSPQELSGLNPLVSAQMYLAFDSMEITACYKLDKKTAFRLRSDHLDLAMAYLDKANKRVEILLSKSRN